MHKTMNEAQQRAVCHGIGPARILAGPGSGKTFVIVNRLQYLIEQGIVRPENILVITFTKAAAKEMQERFQALTAPEILPVRFGTFHAVFYSILKQSNASHFKEILSESDKRKFLQSILRKLPVIFKESTVPTVEELMKWIGQYKNLGENFEQIKKNCTLSQEVFLWAYSSYNQKIKAEKKTDFDDMASRCLELFMAYPEILNMWQEQFRFILIDEFQDINEPQYETIKLLADRHRNLFVVGDDDQSIYGFRGAKPAIMKQFLLDFPESQCILLAYNYRSTKAIVQAAGKCIAKNVDRIAKETQAVKAPGEPVIIKALENVKKEQDFLMQEIQARRAEGCAFGDMAFICRTNFALEELAVWLQKEKIPYCKKEKRRSLFEHEIMGDFEAYLRLAAGERDRKLFLRVINRPDRYISRDYLKKENLSFQELLKICEWEDEKDKYIRQLERDCERMSRMQVYPAINYIRKGIGYEEYLKKSAGLNAERYQELLQVADFIQNSAKEYRTLSDWLFFIEEYKKEYEKDYDAEENKDGIWLLTMHGSKGLEFPYVYLPDVNEGVIPHGRILQKELVEEERRLFYVAMTRAKERLIITYLDGRNTRKRLPSRFLTPLLESQPFLKS